MSIGSILTEAHYAMKGAFLPGHVTAQAYEAVGHGADDTGVIAAESNGHFSELRSMPGVVATSTVLAQAIKQARGISAAHDGQAQAVEQSKDGSLEIRPVLARMVDANHQGFIDRFMDGSSESRDLTPFSLSQHGSEDEDYGHIFRQVFTSDFAPQTKVLVGADGYFTPDAHQMVAFPSA